MVRDSGFVFMWLSEFTLKAKSILATSFPENRSFSIISIIFVVIPWLHVLTLLCMFYKTWEDFCPHLGGLIPGAGCVSKYLLRLELSNMVSMFTENCDSKTSFWNEIDSESPGNLPDVLQVC